MIILGKDKEAKASGAPEQPPEQMTEQAMIELLESMSKKNPEQRSIMFVGEVSEEKAADLISALLVLSQDKAPGQKRASDIKLYISTYGGSAHEMFGIYDVMNYCKQFCDIQTIGIGKVMSAGTLILAAGTKGKRKIGQHCQVMIHTVNGGAMGELHSLENEMEQMKNLQETYIQCLSDETSMSKRHIQRLINRKVNVYLSADEAIEKGLADEVI
jgi:ATP-dependent Clp protease protease subunit